MTPDATEYNPDPEYLRALVESTKLTQAQLAREIGCDERAIRYWLSGQRKFPYTVQFALECLVLSA